MNTINKIKEYKNTGMSPRFFCKHQLFLTVNNSERYKVSSMSYKIGEITIKKEGYNLNREIDLPMFLWLTSIENATKGLEVIADINDFRKKFYINSKNKSRDVENIKSSLLRLKKTTFEITKDNDTNFHMFSILNDISFVNDKITFEFSKTFINFFDINNTSNIFLDAEKIARISKINQNSASLYMYVRHLKFIDCKSQNYKIQKINLQTIYDIISPNQILKNQKRNLLDALDNFNNSKYYLAKEENGKLIILFYPAGNKFNLIEKEIENEEKSKSYQSLMLATGQYDNNDFNDDNNDIPIFN